MTIIIRGGGAGGGFVIEECSGWSSFSIDSSTPLILTPASGKRIRLDSVNAGADFQVKLSGGTVGDIIDGTLDASSPSAAGSWRVGQGASSSNSAGFIPAILFGVDETITLSTLASGIIEFSTSEGA